MELKDAFIKQKKELLDANRQVTRLQKELLKYTKSVAADLRVQELLNDVQRLTRKLSTSTSICNRYKELCDKKDEIITEQKHLISDLRGELNVAKRHISILESPNSKSDVRSSEDTNAEISALKDEIVRLTSQLNANGKNAGVPTAKTPLHQKKLIPNSREKSNLKKGGQPGHSKHEMAPFSENEITQTVDHPLDTCPKCGGHNLEEFSCTIKDEYDYEVSVKKVRHRFLVYTCLDCGASIRQPYNGLVAKNQYGPVVKAMALSLMNIGCVSINRTRKILTGYSPSNVSISEGYLAKLQKRYSLSLKNFVNDLKNHLVSLPLLYWDDTVVFVNTKRACLRFYGNERIALYTAHLHKNLDSLMRDNVLPALSHATTVMHDHNTINYHQGFIFKNTECLQHLERDLQKIIDASNHSWALDLKELIQSHIHLRKSLMENNVSKFTCEEIDSFFSKVNSILKQAWIEWHHSYNRYFSNDEKALICRLENYRDNYFEWIKDFSIPTTNNLSERSLRFIKTKDKVSGQFQSIEYASYFANIRTYLETCARNGINEFNALIRLTQGQPYTVRELLGEA